MMKPTISRELVLKKLRICFPDPNIAEEALGLLDFYGMESWHPDRDRVHLAIIKTCQSDLDRLCRYVDIACQDYRDILSGAEYPGEWRSYNNDTKEEYEALQRRNRESHEAWLRSEN